MTSMQDSPFRTDIYTPPEQQSLAPPLMPAPQGPPPPPTVPLQGPPEDPVATELTLRKIREQVDQYARQKDAEFIQRLAAEGNIAQLRAQQIIEATDGDRRGAMAVAAVGIGMVGQGIRTPETRQKLGDMVANFEMLGGQEYPQESAMLRDLYERGTDIADFQQAVEQHGQRFLESPYGPGPDMVGGLSGARETVLSQIPFIDDPTVRSTMHGPLHILEGAEKAARAKAGFAPRTRKIRMGAPAERAVGDILEEAEWFADQYESRTGLDKSTLRDLAKQSIINDIAKKIREDPEFRQGEGERFANQFLAVATNLLPISAEAKLVEWGAKAAAKVPTVAKVFKALTGKRAESVGKAGVFVGQSAAIGSVAYTMPLTSEEENFLKTIPEEHPDREAWEFALRLRQGSAGAMMLPAMAALSGTVGQVGARTMERLGRSKAAQAAAKHIGVGMSLPAALEIAPYVTDVMARAATVAPGMFPSLEKAVEVQAFTADHYTPFWSSLDAFQRGDFDKGWDHLWNYAKTALPHGAAFGMMGMIPLVAEVVRGMPTDIRSWNRAADLGLERMEAGAMAEADRLAGVEGVDAAKVKEVVREIVEVTKEAIRQPDERTEVQRVMEDDAEGAARVEEDVAVRMVEGSLMDEVAAAARGEDVVMRDLETARDVAERRVVDEDAPLDPVQEDVARAQARALRLHEMASREDLSPGSRAAAKRLAEEQRLHGAELRDWYEKGAIGPEPTGVTRSRRMQTELEQRPRAMEESVARLGKRTPAGDEMIGATRDLARVVRRGDEKAAIEAIRKSVPRGTKVRSDGNVWVATGREREGVPMFVGERGQIASAREIILDRPNSFAIEAREAPIPGAPAGKEAPLAWESPDVRLDESLALEGPSREGIDPERWDAVRAADDRVVEATEALHAAEGRAERRRASKALDAARKDARTARKEAGLDEGYRVRGEPARAPVEAPAGGRPGEAEWGAFRDQLRETGVLAGDLTIGRLREIADSPPAGLEDFGAAVKKVLERLPRAKAPRVRAEALYLAMGGEWGPGIISTKAELTFGERVAEMDELFSSAAEDGTVKYFENAMDASLVFREGPAALVADVYQPMRRLLDKVTRLRNQVLANPELGGVRTSKLAGINTDDPLGTINKLTWAVISTGHKSLPRRMVEAFFTRRSYILRDMVAEIGRNPQTGFTFAQRVLKNLKALSPGSTMGFIFRDGLMSISAGYAASRHLEQWLFDMGGVLEGIKEGSAEDIQLRQMLDQGPKAKVWKEATPELQETADTLRRKLREIRSAIIAVHPYSRRLRTEIRVARDQINRLNERIETRIEKLLEDDPEHDISRDYPIKQINLRIKRIADRRQRLAQNFQKWAGQWGFENYVPDVLFADTDVESVREMLGGSLLSSAHGVKRSRGYSTAQVQLGSVREISAGPTRHRKEVLRNKGLVDPSAMRSLGIYFRTMPLWIKRMEFLSKIDEFMHGRLDYLSDVDAVRPQKEVVYMDDAGESYGLMVATGEKGKRAYRTWKSLTPEERAEVPRARKHVVLWVGDPEQAPKAEDLADPSRVAEWSKHEAGGDGPTRVSKLHVLSLDDATTMLRSWKDGWYGEALKMAQKRTEGYEEEAIRSVSKWISALQGVEHEVATGRAISWKDALEGKISELSKLGQAADTTMSFLTTLAVANKLGGPTNLANAITAGGGGIITLISWLGRLPRREAFSVARRIAKVERRSRGLPEGWVKSRFKRFRRDKIAEAPIGVRGDDISLTEHYRSLAETPAEELARMSPEKRQRRQWEDEAIAAALDLGIIAETRSDRMETWQQRVATNRKGKPRKIRREGDIADLGRNAFRALADSFWHPFTTMERYARATAFAEGYVSAREAGKDPAAARAEGYALNHQVNFQLAKIARPEFMRNPVARLLGALSMWGYHNTGRFWQLSAEAKVQWFRNTTSMVLLGRMFGLDLLNLVGSSMSWTVGSALEDAFAEEAEYDAPIPVPLTWTGGGPVFDFAVDAAQAATAITLGDPVAWERFERSARRTFDPSQANWLRKWVYPMTLSEQVEPGVWEMRDSEGRLERRWDFRQWQPSKFVPGASDWSDASLADLGGSLPLLVGTTLEQLPLMEKNVEYIIARKLSNFAQRTRYTTRQRSEKVREALRVSQKIKDATDPDERAVLEAEYDALLTEVDEMTSANNLPALSKSSVKELKRGLEAEQWMTFPERAVMRQPTNNAKVEALTRLLNQSTYSVDVDRLERMLHAYFPGGFPKDVPPDMRSDLSAAIRRRKLGG